MTQRNVELVIGRLLTDEEFRQAFIADPDASLRTLVERGIDLSAAEVAVLTRIDSSLFCAVADQIDPRLQKARLT